MRIVILPTAKEVSNFAADTIAQTIAIKNNAVLGLATGSTPIDTYKILIKKNKKKQLSFKDTTTFNLDEYVGLKPEHHQSYQYFMNDKLFNHIDINIDNTNFPQCLDGKYTQSCNNYEYKINNYKGIDIQLLGLGDNGHIGFNEPTSSLTSLTRIKTLTEKTITSNSRFFEKTEKQPKLAITMGIGTIMSAKKILLLGIGENKKNAVANIIEGPISAFCPGSILQMHNNAIIVLDEKAASKLKLHDYYIHAEKLQNEITY